MKKTDCKHLLLILITSILVFYITQDSFAYIFMKNGDIRCSTRGAVIRKIQGNIVYTKCIQPKVDITLKNTSKKGKKISLVCKNISPRLYGASVDKSEIQRTGINFVVFNINLKALSTRTVTIAPLQKNLKRYTYAVLGDSRHRTKIHKKILKQIARSKALFAINLGDVMNHGTHKEYMDFLDEISDFPLPYYIVPGNHEIIAKGGFGRFLKYVSPVDYSFDLGNYHFVLLDSAKASFKDSQFTWLENELKGHKNNFVFHHVPPFSPHPAKKRHVIASKNQSARFVRIMEKYNVKAMFAGHIHAFLRTKKNGIDYIIAGCAGAYPVVPPEEGGYPHYVLVNVDGDNYSIRVYRVK